MACQNQDAVSFVWFYVFVLSAVYFVSLPVPYAVVELFLYPCLVLPDRNCEVG